MQSNGRPWHKSPLTAHRPLDAAYRRVGYWADRAAHAILTQNKEDEAYAREKLEEALTTAYQRMGVHSSFGTEPSPHSIIESYGRNTLQKLSMQELFALVGKGLFNDPLADIVITRELIRRGELSETAAEDVHNKYLPLTGADTEQTPTPTSPKETPWRGKKNYASAGANGYPATYREILTEYAKGAEACDNNLPISTCLQGNRQSKPNERTLFLAGVWKAGWRRRRSQILHAQIASGAGEKFADQD